MRQKFDRGEDPMDAEEERERQRGGGFPGGFHHQGFHGHPGNMKFKFHFN